MLKRILRNVLVLVVAGIVAYGYAHFVYASNPLLVWALLLFCWLCYRLRLRAVAMFSGRESVQDRASRPFREEYQTHSGGSSPA